MNKQARILNLFLLLSIVGLLFSPTCPLISKAFALSIQEEIELGEEFVTRIRKHFEVMEEGFPRQYLDHLGKYLGLSPQTRPFPLRFYIIKDNTLNAFAGPGGHIFIFSGLIRIMDSADELAAILCHEIGHVSARHLSKRIAQSKKIGLATLAGVLAGVLIGGGPAAEALIAGSMAAGKQAQLHYSRTDERQADHLGFRHMKSTGFDPEAMISTLRKMGSRHWLGNSDIPPYLLTHPTGPERMANLDNMMTNYEFKPTAEAEYFKELFPVFKTIVLAKSLSSSDAERTFKRELETGSKSLAPHLGLGMVYKERSRYQLAVNHLKKSLETRPRSLPVLRHLGESYKMSGQPEKAMLFLKKALSVDRNDKSTLLILAKLYEDLERYGEALDLLNRLKAFPPVDTRVFYHSGICYGRQNRLALAHYNFGIYYKKLGERSKARFHFRKAYGLAGGNPELREEIEESGKGFL